MNVSEGKFVRIDCELRVPGGEVIESSSKSGPVEYRHGAGQLPPGLEARLEGMSVGEEKSGVIPAAEAFGKADDERQVRLSRSQFPPDTKLETGARFAAKSPQGTPITLEVVTMEDSAAIAKVVHPLAGKDLEFKVKVLSVRPPPPPVPKATDAVELAATELESDPALKSSTPTS
jgi:FKBP-type peptidyl-prolyl cis-trans isomerase 2